MTVKASYRCDMTGKARSLFCLIVLDHFLYLLRGGGGVHPDYFVKLDFEIAVDQQTKARVQTFEGVPDSG